MSRLARPRLAIAAGAGGLALGGGLAAAATGSLPGAAQSIASEVLNRVGIQVPSANTHAGSHPNTRARSDTDATNAPPGPGSAPQGSTISHLAQTTPATGVDKGAAICSAASSGQCQAGHQGAGTGASPGAPVATANHGGAGTANTASGGASKMGTTTASSASGGASSAGSGNAASQGGASTATSASGGASSAGSSEATANPAGGTANGASGGTSTAGSLNAAHGGH